MKSPALISFILYLDLVAFTIILPLFPSIIDWYDERNRNATEPDVWLDSIHQLMSWMKKLLNMPDKRRYNNVLVGGILGSLFSILQFISSPMIGALSDSLGRKKILAISMIGTTISYIVWYRADTFTVFLLSRIIGGLCKGSVTLSTAIISDITSKENRGKGMAFVGISFSLAFLSGPLIGAYFASQAQNADQIHSFSQPALIAIVFQLVSIVSALFLMDETLPVEKRQPFSVCLSKVVSLINPLNIFLPSSKDNTNSLTLCKLVSTNFLYLLFFSGLEFTLTFLTHERFNFTSMQQGKLFFFAGLIMMLVQGGYVRRVKQNKEKKIAMQGIVVIIPAMMLMSITSSIQLTYFALLLYSFGAATVVPCLTSLFTQHSEESEAGENIGKFRSAGALARAIAPAVTCAVYWSFGSMTCYMVGAMLFVLPLFLLMNTKTVDFVKEKST